uniref:Uncharacterized protein n=1 Tax=Arundo donax TaxID=35708 RepID=A0A0A9EZV5_ARUDO
MWCLCSAAERKMPTPSPPSVPPTNFQASQTLACSPRATAHGRQHQHPLRTCRGTAASRRTRPGTAPEPRT